MVIPMVIRLSSDKTRKVDDVPHGRHTHTLVDHSKTGSLYKFYVVGSQDRTGSLVEVRRENSLCDTPGPENGCDGGTKGDGRTGMEGLNRTLQGGYVAGRRVPMVYEIRNTT